jgi:hypothetical protein
MTETQRRSKGWPRTGVDQTSTTSHLTSTGEAVTPLADDEQRDIRESKWTARDHFVSQGTAGRTASGSQHRAR